MKQDLRISAISAVDSKHCTALHQYITEIIATVQSKNQVTLQFLPLHSNLSAVVEYKGYLAVPVDDCFLYHHSP